MFLDALRRSSLRRRRLEEPEPPDGDGAGSCAAGGGPIGGGLSSWGALEDAVGRGSARRKRELAALRLGDAVRGDTAKRASGWGIFSGSFVSRGLGLLVGFFGG